MIFIVTTKLRYKAFDEYEVKDWLGHTKIGTTMSYIKDAKHYYLLAPYDWIYRIFKVPNMERSNKGIQKNTVYLRTLNILRL